jgi:opine dehydrogenase
MLPVVKICFYRLLENTIQWRGFKMARVDRVAILGGGNAGHACAADLTLAGLEVNMYELPEFKENIRPVLERGGIELTGVGRKGFANLNYVGTEIKEALHDVELIFVTVPAYGHERFAQLCAPYLQEGHVVVLHPGHPGGALQFVNTLKQTGLKENVRVAETNTLAYTCRLIGPAEINIFLITKKLFTAALPAKYTSEVVQVLKDLYPSVVAAANVLESSLDDINGLLHTPIALLNAAKIENTGGKFLFYTEGATPSVASVIEAMDSERIAIAEAAGLKLNPFHDLLFESGWFDTRKNTIYEAIRASEFLRTVSGPNSLQHRYITEDVPYGLVPIASIGDLLGVETTTTKSLIKIASVINKTDYWKVGRTAEKLGIAGFTADKLGVFLEEGAI